MQSNKAKNTHLLGEKYENMAVEYLEAMGYSILERNARFHHLETDIIARDGKYLCFIEVKGRKSGSLSSPYEAVSRKKIQFLRTMAEGYLVKQHLSLYDTPCRFDVLCISGEDIELIKNAF